MGATTETIRARCLLATALYEQARECLALARVLATMARETMARRTP
jgi:hypothetical protein